MRRRLSVTSAALAASLAIATIGGGGAGARAFPDEIALPDGFAPEGIATGRGATFYAGSLSLAGIWRGDYRTGEGSLLVDGGGPFVGMTVDGRNRLWVAGGPAGVGYLFDAATGAPLKTFAFADAPTFVNDVVVTTDAAYFTDSMQPALYRVAIGPGGTVGGTDTIELDADAIGFEAGAFNLNGIVATPDGDTLITVNSTAGALFTVDPATGDVAEISLGGASVAAGDGLLLHGRTLYVVRNQLNLVAVVELAPGLGQGTVVDVLEADGFDVPTTIARFGGDLYAVNARFGTPVTTGTAYWVTRVEP
jgi:sugar lactone lactonase YvrE